MSQKITKHFKVTMSEHQWRNFAWTNNPNVKVEEIGANDLDTVKSKAQEINDNELSDVPIRDTIKNKIKCVEDELQAILNIVERKVKA